MNNSAIHTFIRKCKVDVALGLDNDYTRTYLFLESLGKECYLKENISDRSSLYNSNDFSIIYKGIPIANVTSNMKNKIFSYHINYKKFDEFIEEKVIEELSFNFLNESKQYTKFVLIYTFMSKIKFKYKDKFITFKNNDI
jgi:hypothetical protein